MLCFLNFNFYIFNVELYFGLDLLSFGLVLLRVWVCALIIMSRRIIKIINLNYNYFLFNILILLILLVLTFRTLNLFIFYVFFESSLIPTMFLIFG